MLLVFTFLCATNQAKALTFEGAFDFHRNLAERNKIGFEKLDKAKKKDFTVNKPEKDKDQTFESKIGDKCTKLREDMSLSRSSISISVRSRRKLKFQNKG